MLVCAQNQMTIVSVHAIENTIVMSTTTGALMLCIGAMLVLFPPGEGRQYEPRTPWAGRTFVILWNAVGIASAAHYFVQPGAWNVGGVALFGIYLAVGIVPIVLMTRRWLRMGIA